MSADSAKDEVYSLLVPEPGSKWRKIPSAHPCYGPPFVIVNGIEGRDVVCSTSDRYEVANFRYTLAGFNQTYAPE